MFLEEKKENFQLFQFSSSLFTQHPKISKQLYIPLKLALSCQV